jgi:hypothetical protein
MIRFMTFDPNGIGNKLHKCRRNKGAIAVGLRLNLAPSPASYEQSQKHGWRSHPYRYGGVIALNPNYEPAYIKSICSGPGPRGQRQTRIRGRFTQAERLALSEERGPILLALGDTNAALEDFIAALRIKCRQRFVVPERRSLIRDRSKLKRLTIPARASLGRDDCGGDPLAAARSAASIYLCAPPPWPFVSGKVRIWSLFIITLTRSASCSILFPSMVTVFSPRPSSRPT